MRVIGTAGHVDHGKSTLVQALTGIDPDRLKEEKKRQMTIDLGFAWYESAGVGTVGIVDVPGHRDFIENMLAGVGGLDAVILVIAADEGIMPQTREHLAIIDLLKIRNGLVAVTKIDLVEDPDWLDLVESDIREVLRGTTLDGAPVLRVSSTTGEGIAEIKNALDELLRELGPRINLGRARLPVDRVFSITGFGTVVTGTLVGGAFSIDDQIEVLPSGKRGRVRGLQSHKKPESEMLPGTRTAMNISGIDVAEVKRGDTIVHPGEINPTRRIDAWLEVLPDATVGIKHNDRMKLFLAATETIARIRLLHGQNLNPGGGGWVQIETENEIVAEKDDRFIIRRMSPAETLGGGSVVDPHPKGRYKLNDALVITRLEAKISSTVRDKLLALISDKPFIDYRELAALTSVIDTDFTDALEALVASETVKRIPSIPPADTRLVEMAYWRQITKKALSVLGDFHIQYPLRTGMHVGELGRRIRAVQSELSHLIKTWELEELIKTSEDSIALAGFEVKYTSNQQKRIQEFNALVIRDPFNPPNVKDARAMLTDDVYQSLIEQGEMVQVSPDVVLHAREYQKMTDFVVNEIGKGSLLTLAEFRDHFSTSRKYAQAFLEHLDRKGVTVREGDGRRLKNSTNII